MRSAPAFLAGLGLVAYLVSMGLPAVQVMGKPLPGWEAAYMSAWFTVSLIWTVVLREPLPTGGDSAVYPLGTLANLLVLGGFAFAWKLRRQPSVLLGLFGGATLSALLVPVVPMLFAVTSPVAGSVTLSDWTAGYRECLSGYWCWTGSMAVLTITVLSLWLSNRRERGKVTSPIDVTPPPRSTGTCSTE